MSTTIMKMFIDAHHHLWDLQAVDYPWLNAKGVERFFGNPEKIQKNYLLKDYRAHVAEYGFRGSIHVQVGSANPLQEAQWVDNISKRNPDWPIAQVAFIDLTSSTLNDDLDQLQTLASVRGVRQIIGRAPGEDQQTGTQALIKSAAFSDGLGLLSERNISFDLQLIPELIRPVANILQQHPDLKVALCHAGSPYNHSIDGLNYWQQELQLLANLPNVYCKLSGLGMFQHHWQISDFEPIVTTCLAQFGDNRCMFGSNFPVDSLYSDFPTLLRAYQALIPVELHPQVFAKTAQKFYQL